MSDFEKKLIGKKVDVSMEQLAHEFTMIKLQRKISNGEISTEGDLLEFYVNQVDSEKCFLKEYPNLFQK